MNNKEKVINNYKDFINFSKNIFNNKTVNSYDCEYSYTNKTFKIQDYLVYNIESQAINNFFREWFEEDEKQLFVFTNKENNYQFLCNNIILDILLTAEVCKEKHIALNREFKLTCKNGKIRDIIAPCDEIKGLLQDLNGVLQLVYDWKNNDFQVAYKKTKSIKDNAKSHSWNNHIFKIDLHNFFPSCKKVYVEKYIRFLFNNTINSDFLENKFLDAILHDDALFIGSPISGTLANRIIAAPVLFMKRICDKFNISFSVYADDMTFSSSKYLNKQFVIDIFNRAFIKYNMDIDFTLNEKKCYGASHNKRCITGVVINHNNELTCHRYMYQKIRQTLYQLSKADESHFNYNKLCGNIAYASMVDSSGKIVRLLQKYKATVLKYKLVTAEKLNSLGVN